MVYRYCVALFLILPALSGAGPTSKFGDKIELCHRSSPDLMKCLTKALHDATRKFVDGHKPAGIMGIDPVLVDVLDIGETQGSSLNLKQKYDHAKITGLSKCEYPTKKAVFTDDECRWQIEATCPQIVLLAHYTLQGKILVFPLNSEGPSNTTLNDVTVLFDVKCEKYMKKDKKHIRVTDLIMDVKPKSLHYDYLHLVPDNEEISNHMLEVFNENALIIYNEIKPNLNIALALVFKQLVDAPLAKIPEDELFLD